MMKQKDNYYSDQERSSGTLERQYLSKTTTSKQDFNIKEIRGSFQLVCYKKEQEHKQIMKLLVYEIYPTGF